VEKQGRGQVAGTGGGGAEGGESGSRVQGNFSQKAPCAHLRTGIKGKEISKAKMDEKSGCDMEGKESILLEKRKGEKEVGKT